jgi:RNA polymerase sigma factor (sigma-70 family)
MNLENIATPPAEPALLPPLKLSNTDKNRLVKKLIDEHYGFIYKLKAETGLSEDDLKDLYTDTVMLILDHMENGTFKGESKLSTYFFRIYYFKTVDFTRKSASNKIDYMNELPEVNDSQQNVTRDVETKDEMNQIVLLLDKMCSPCREIIMDWAYWGLKSEEIGEKIGERNPIKFSKLKYNCLDKFKKLWSKQMSTFE